jgi:AhpD family alkylhydroperoxidase
MRTAQLKRWVIAPAAIIGLCVALFGPAARVKASDAAAASLDALEKSARQRAGAQSRVALAPVTSDVFKGIELLEPAETGRVPNYLRALAGLPRAVGPFAHLFKTAIYTGAVAPELKMAMGLRVAQAHNSPYTAAHLIRLLKASERGQAILAAMKADNLNSLPAADRLALGYAELLTRDVHGVSDADYQKTRAAYNDAQIIELTMTVCFFNYFTRLCEALNLPVEPWALDSIGPRADAAGRFEPPVARVALITDAEIAATSTAAAAAKDAAAQAGGLGLGMANSQRAMLRVPAFALAWRGYGAAVREYASVGRDIKLHVSFAVSMANGCRYCTLHQVLGLRRLGVDPAKLVAMKKDDAALAPRELTAVLFARKLTREPSSITASDYERLRREFGEQGALEVLLQACAFNFMNRFTDGLRLPSEDEAIRVYREVYGADFSQVTRRD